MASLANRSGIWVLAVAIVGSGMSFIDGTAVNVALPVLQRDFNATASQLQWVIEGYALFLSALILLGGSLGDHYGRRAMFALGIALFAGASLACAAASSVGLLIAARCLQGMGGALATPGSLALISSNFSGEARGRAIGTWSGFAAVTAALGPLLGGWLVQAFSWRFVFLINVPLAAFVLLVAFVRVPESRDEETTHHLDLRGAALATLGLGLLVYGLIELQGRQSSGHALTYVVTGIVVLCFFVAHERWTTTPMMPLQLFASRTFSGANLYTFLLYATLGGGLYFVPFNLINVQGYTPEAAGAALLPFILIMFVFSRWSGGLVARIGARMPLALGATIAAGGFAAYALAGIGHSYWTSFFPAACILGIGGALFVAPLTTAVMDSVATSEAGIASGINNAVSRTAGLLAIAVLGIALASEFNASFARETSALSVRAQTARVIERDRFAIVDGHVPFDVAPADRDAVTKAIHRSYVRGFRNTMLLSALLALAAAGAALLMIPRGLKRPPIGHKTLW